MKKILFPILVFLFLLQSISAQNVELQVSEYNITYHLMKKEFFVEEDIVFGNTGDNFKGNITLLRGNAWNVEVILGPGFFGERYEIAKFGDNTLITLVNFRIGRDRTREVGISYSRSDLLDERDSIKIFRGSAIWPYENLPVFNTLVRFLTPEGYQFGNIVPKTSTFNAQVGKGYEGKSEVVTYTLPLLIPRQDFPVELEYADYETITRERISTVKSIISEAKYAIRHANLSIENAKRYDTNLTYLLSLYNASLQSLLNSQQSLSIAEIMLYEGNFNSSMYLLAYDLAAESEKEGNEAIRVSRELENSANFEIQEALERKISELGSNITTQTQNFNENLQKIAGTQRESPGTKQFSYLISLLVIFIAILFIFAKTFRGIKSGRRGEVKDFTVIEDLKSKTFEGFEEKIDKVKKEVSVASEIRMLKRERERLELGIEDLRKKRLANKISEEIFKLEKKGLEEKINALDIEIDVLEDKLKRTKGEKNESRAY